METLHSPVFLPMPPEDLLDVQDKLKLRFNGIQASPIGARLVYTCTLPPCQGASFDVPLGADAAAVEQAYIDKRDQFVRAEMLGKVRDLIGHATSVREDRLDITREFALQTLDWCEGLLDLARQADAAVTAFTAPKEAA